MELVPDRSEGQDHSCKTFTVYYLSLSTQSVTLSWLRVAVLCVTKGLCISPVLSAKIMYCV